MKSINQSEQYLVCRAELLAILLVIHASSKPAPTMNLRLQQTYEPSV